MASFQAFDTKHQRPVEVRPSDVPGIVLYQPLKGGRACGRLQSATLQEFVARFRVA